MPGHGNPRPPAANAMTDAQARKARAWSACIALGTTFWIVAGVAVFWR